jgi:ADP-heptose:LPS heptosyltransferase
MIDPTDLPASVRTILVTRLDALGDVVLGTMLLSGLHAKWPGAIVQLVVRPQMAGVAALLPDWVQVLPLPIDPREPIGTRHGEIAGQLRDFAATVKPDLAVVGEYSRTWASEIVAQICGAANVLAFNGPGGLTFAHREICKELDVASRNHWKTVDAHTDEREPAKYAKFLQSIGIDDPRSCPPFIVLRPEDREAAGVLWAQSGVTPHRAVVCFPGSGEGLARSLDAPSWSRWIARLMLNRPVVLFGSEGDAAALDAVEKCGLPPGVGRVTVPMEQTGLAAAFLERAGAYIGMDTGPMHMAAVLGRPTLGVFGGGHRAERFLPVGRRAAAVRMPLGCYGCEWLCPFDSRLCIKELPEWPLCEAADEFLGDTTENPDPFSPRIFDIPPPAELPTVLLGPIMRQHRRFLDLNHQLIEHHDFLARVSADQQNRIDSLSQLAADVARQNHERGEAIVNLSAALAEMTRHNTARDEAIAHLAATLAEMTRQNEGRDGAINHINQTLAAMTEQNVTRDRAIGELNGRTKGRKK